MGVVRGWEAGLESAVMPDPSVFPFVPPEVAQIQEPSGLFCLIQGKGKIFLPHSSAAAAQSSTS